MTAAHAEAAPSAMARTMQCAFSLPLCRQYPQDPNEEAAMEGTAAHWVLEKALREEPLPAVDALAPNGVAVTEEMLDGAELFYDTVSTDFPGALATAHTEERVDCFDIHPACWGTPDYWVLDEKTGVLYVYDYKFGHRFVHAFENWQMLTYLIGILKRLGARASVLRIEIRIVQPRNFHKDGPVRTWTLAVKDVAHYAERIKEAVYRAFQEAPQATTGPECDYCSGRHACTAQQEKAMRAVEISRLGIPIEMSPEAAGGELRMIWDAIRTLEARATGLEAVVTQAVKAGKRIVGLGLEASEGRVAWTAPIEEVLSLGEAMGVPLAKPAALTPRQAVKAGMPKDVVDGFSARKSGAVKLALINDNVLRKAFSQSQE